MSTPRVYAGADAPESLTVTIAQGLSTLDLSTVTAVAFEATDDKGEVVSWPAAIVEQTPSQLIAKHVFAPSDIPVKGVRTVLPRLTLVGGGTRRAAPFALEVA